MRVDSPLPPILPEASGASGRISSFSSSLDSRMQVASEMPVPATAAVETETQGHEPGRLRRPLKRQEDRQAEQRKKHQDGEDEPSRGQVMNGQDPAEAGAQESESPEHELDVRL